MKSRAFVFCFFAILSVAQAAPPSAETLRVISEHYLAKTALPPLEKGFSMEEGLAAQSSLVQLLTPKLGPVAGYKIGLITKQGQERMGASGPVHGVLLKKMLLSNNAKVSVRYGLRPAAELDMGVFVKDSGINGAKSFRQVIAHLSDLVCFIELIDTLTDSDQPMDAALLTSLNVGARAGVVGERRKLTHAMVDALPNMKMTLTDDSGKIIAEVPRLNLQPLENILWLIEDLKKYGGSLKRGDFISLGSPSTPQPIAAGKKLTLLYEGLPGGPMTASVIFTE